MNLKKHILIAPLNWGLGHATRCIPIINALIEHNYEPIIASDGIALHLLKKEFPDIKTIELPSYNIKYSKKGYYFKLKLLKETPKILKAIRAENIMVKNSIDAYNIKGIISDNRLGVYSNKIPSVFITHQLNVLSGSTTWFSSKMHRQIIKKFDECWIPDIENDPNLSGALGHLKNHDFKIKYIGPLSRFNKIDGNIIYDLLVLLSGPEPQRTILENILLEQLKVFDGNILFVKGKVEAKQAITKKDPFTIYNFMLTQELEKAINQSKFVLSRPGYTTIMDLAKLKKKAFFIPTPGQYEQDYLAKRLNKMKIAPCCKQEDFNIGRLLNLDNYIGFGELKTTVNYKNLFCLFESK